MRWQHLIIALVIASAIALAVIQQDTRFHAKCETLVRNLFEQTFDCKVKYARLKGINLFTCSLWAEDIQVEAADGSAWSWKADYLHLKGSWLYLLMHKKMGLNIIVQNVAAKTTIKEKKPAIAEHIKKMIDGAPGMPIVLRSLHIQKGSLSTDSCQDYSFDIPFNVALFHDDFNTLNVQADVAGGAVAGSLLPTFNKIDLQLNVQKKKTEQVPQINCNAQWICPSIQSPDQKMSLHCNVEHNEFSVLVSMLKNKLISLKGSVKSLTDFEGIVHATVPLSCIDELCAGQGKLNFGGECSVDGTLGMVAGKPFMNGTVQIEGLNYQSFTIGSAHLSLVHQDDNCNGAIVITTPSCGSWDGSFSFDTKNWNGLLNGSLQSPIALHLLGLSIDADNSWFSASYDQSGLNGNYEWSLYDQHTQKKQLLPGSFKSNDRGVVLNGKQGDNSYQLALEETGNGYQLTGNYSQSDKGTLIQCVFDQLHQLRISLDYRLVRLFLERLFNISVKGEGTLLLEAEYKNGLLHGSLNMKNGSIQLAPTYNFIKNLLLSITIDPRKPSIVLQDGIVELYEGVIKVPRAVVMMNNNGTVHFAHMPLVFEKVFLNLEKECFLIMSGAVLFLKNAEGPSIKGRLLLDKAKLKKNIFSVVTSKQLVSPFKIPFENTAFDGALDLSIMTKKPMKIKTSFLDTDVNINWRVKGTCANPLIMGKVVLSRGTLFFPYRPLHIISGALYFSQVGSTFDPEVSFVAKGRVRQFDVTLRVIGSLLHPHMSLESTPPLTEEQIITLLLIGSESGSLSLIMPTLIMNNMRHLLFGPEVSLTKLESYFKSLLAPLKNIRIVPKFTDQSGRGGLRGAIEIDINDQLHGLIQKNFSQPEDMLFEVEYVLSDDVTLRGIRDEHGDLGGEVEMRWKF